MNFLPSKTSIIKSLENNKNKLNHKIYQFFVVFLFGLFAITSFSGYAQKTTTKTDQKPSTTMSLGSSGGSTLEIVKKNGGVKCGVAQSLPGFASPDQKGNWSGIDVDICKAIAAAIFNDPQKVTFVPLSAKERFTALQSAEIDILSRNTTVTLTRDTTLGFDFTGVTYYDGQGFMVLKKLGVTKISQLSGATICVQTGTTSELNLADYFTSHNLKYKMVAFETNDEIVKAYDSARCDAITTDQSGLYAIKQKLKTATDHIVLSELISKEPLGPAVRHGDNKWADIIRWTFYAMLAAEEYGITSKNVDQLAKTTKNPTIARILGVDSDLGKKLGLDKKWAHQVIKHVGNYQQVFDRNLGQGSTLKIERGINTLWTKGGLHYPMPFR